MSDRRQRRRQDHIIMYSDEIPAVGMHGDADWPRENARTHARTAQLVCTRACTVVRAYLWISIQWWCLLEILRRFPPSTPASCCSVPENHDALLREARCRKSSCVQGRSNFFFILPLYVIPLTALALTFFSRYVRRRCDFGSLALPVEGLGPPDVPRRQSGIVCLADVRNNTWTLCVLRVYEME